MPNLLQSNHLVIGKAGGATVHEAIAARCSMIINQVITGQEEGNAQLVRSLELGVVAESGRQVRDAVEQAFAHHAWDWADWRNHMSALSKPDAALRIAELLLGEEAGGGPRPRQIKLCPSCRPGSAPPGGENGDRARMLLCDFHIHTNYSDWKLTLPEVVDFPE
jgi:processive 1,2-diacylglycerol beta-glucosyltransferase